MVVIGEFGNLFDELFRDNGYLAAGAGGFTAAMIAFEPEVFNGHALVNDLHGLFVCRTQANPGEGAGLDGVDVAGEEALFGYSDQDFVDALLSVTNGGVGLWQEAAQIIVLFL